MRQPGSRGSALALHWNFTWARLSHITNNMQSAGTTSPPQPQSHTTQTRRRRRRRRGTPNILINIYKRALCESSALCYGSYMLCTIARAHVYTIPVQLWWWRRVTIAYWRVGSAKALSLNGRAMISHFACVCVCYAGVCTKHQHRWWWSLNRR